MPVTANSTHVFITVAKYEVLHIMLKCYVPDFRPHGLSQMNLNLLKPTGHVMHQQFNIQQLYALPTLYLCVLYLTENKQRLLPLTA